MLSPGSGTAPQGLVPGGAGCEVGVACGQLIRWFPSRQAGPGSAGLAAAPRACVRVFATVVFALGSGCLTSADRRVEAVYAALAPRAFQRRFCAGSSFRLWFVLALACGWRLGMRLTGVTWLAPRPEGSPWLSLDSNPGSLMSLTTLAILFIYLFGDVSGGRSRARPTGTNVYVGFLPGRAHLKRSA